MTGIPINSYVGDTDPFTVNVSDGRGGGEVSLPMFTITVTNTNDAPTINGTPPDATQGMPYSWTPGGMDVDAGDTLTYSITGNPTWLTIDSTSGTLSGTPGNADVGPANNIVIMVHDGTMGSSLGFNIEIINVNDAPTITGTPPDATQGMPYSWTPDGMDVDEGTTLTYTITNKPDWASFSSTTGVLTGTPTNADVGTTTGIVISVSDGIIATPVSLPAFDLTVTNTNDAPTITGAPGTTVAEDALYTFTAVGADVDTSDTLTYTIANNPGWASFSSTTGVLTGTPTNADVGTTTGIVISVSDGIIATPVSLPAFDLTVTNTNDAPTITGTPRAAANEDELYEFTPGGGDVDADDTAVYSITTTPSWATFSTTTGVLTGTPDNGDVGESTTDITITVTAGGEPARLGPFTITVFNTNDVPTITGTPPTTVVVGVVYSFMPVGADVDVGATLTYSITGNPTWLTIDSVTGVVSGTPEATDLEVLPTNIIITVTDEAGGTASLPAFTITLTNPNLGFADLNKVVLPEVARAMTDQTVNAITQRMDQARSGEGSRSMTIGGQSTLAGAASVHGQAIADGSLSLKDVLGNSDFVLPLADDEAGTDNGILSFLTLWGGGDYRNLEGSGGSTNFDGNLFSTHLGVDARPRDDLLTGLAVSWGEGDLDYRGDNLDGDYKLDLTSVHPYASWEVLAGQLDLWATAGYGWGDLEILDDEQGEALSDVEAWNMAVGGNMELLQQGPARFRLKSSALLTEMKVEGSADITALEVDSSLLRMILEGAYKHALAGEAYVEPSLEAGVRYDGGDGETGFGAELGAGLRYTDPVAGLTLESKARTLLGRDNY